MSPVHGMDMSDVWTPKLVGERLVEAIRWARYNAGSTGPAGMKAAFHGFLPTADDFEDEGWGQKEIAEIEEDKPRRRYSPTQITAILDALEWTGRYTVNENPTSTRVLNLWLRCKVYRGSFEKAVEHRGEMSRRSAYNYRDRALSAIAQGLTRDGIKP